MAKQNERTLENITFPKSNDMLGLDGFELDPVETPESFYFKKRKKIILKNIKANVLYEGRPQCNCGSNMPMVLHDYKKLTVKDIFHGRSNVAIVLRRPRFKCHRCKKTTTITPDVIHHRHYMTRRLVEEIQILGLEHPFTRVEKMTGVNEKIIRNIVNEFIEILDKAIPLTKPNVVGIDEAHSGVLTAALLVITDIENGMLLELSEDGLSREVVEDVLIKMSGDNDVKYGVSDMCGSYHRAMKNIFPNLPTIVDKRHVQIKAKEALATVRDQVRIKTKKNSAKLYGDRGIINKRRHQLNESEMKKIVSWSKRYPRLGKAYDLKEGFYDLYNYEAFGKAMYAFEAWSKSIPNNLENEFGPVRDMFIREQRQIKNYFDSGKKYTNAVTETINGLVKEIDRTGRGYSFKVLRAKALHKYGIWNEEAIHEHVF